MKRFLPFLFSSVLVCASMAQIGFGGRASQPNLLSAGAGYLMLPAVQKELGLSAGVTRKIQDKMGAVTRSMMGLGNASGKPKDQAAQMSDFQKRLGAIQKVQGECLAMLNTSQKARLKQITLQQLGPQAMGNPEVKKELGLNEGQVKKIGQIMQASFQQMYSSTGAKPGERPSREDAMKRMQEFAKKQEATRLKVKSETLKVLTPSQQSKWKTMQGKPFKMDMLGMMRSMGGATPQRVAKPSKLL